MIINSNRLEVLGRPNWKPLVGSAALIGVGMGGFLDGIVFHQILQAHNTVSARIFPDTLAKVEIGMFWDGIFHAAVWIASLLGVAWLWRAVRRPDVPLSTSAFVSALFLGWGIFNFFEGIVDHHLIGLHHVVERADPNDQVLYDLLFLFSGIFLAIGGMWGIQRARREFDAARAAERTAGGTDAVPGLRRASTVFVESERSRAVPK